MMQAIVQHAYGAGVAEPTPGPHDVLVGVHAASVNHGDWFATSGWPCVIRAALGLRRPRVAVPGYAVLVNDASEGVGTFAVQIAKTLGVDVTGVCSTHNVQLVRSLGADHVIDYTREDFARSGHQYDPIFDLAAQHPRSSKPNRSRP